MADLYKATAGTLIKSGSGGGFVSIAGMSGILKGGRMLVTSVRVNRQQDVQFLKTLSAAFYIYAFGEAPGQVTVGGLLFFQDCGGSTGNIVTKINEFYEKNNAYAKASILGVAIGGASFPCLLTALSFSGDMTPYNYISFSLGFTLVPRGASGSEDAGGGEGGEGGEAGAGGEGGEGGEGAGQEALGQPGFSAGRGQPGFSGGMGQAGFSPGGGLGPGGFGGTGFGNIGSPSAPPAVPAPG